MKETLRQMGRLRAEDMYYMLEVLGKDAGIKEVLASKTVAQGVKDAYRNLFLCMANVVGSDAHRTTLRHMNNSYKLLFGPPLVFTTPNVADTQNPVMNLIYEGEVVCSFDLLDGVHGWWRLEEEAPEMPSAQEMCRRVARDPVGQARFFHLMLELFLVHVLGVEGVGGAAHPDGVAAGWRGGLFGAVQAYFGPIETQGRGGLHAHIHVWVLQPLSGFLLAQLRAGNFDVGELPERLRTWRSRVLEKVATMQFDAVEEVARQLRLPGDPAAPARVAELCQPCNLREHCVCGLRTSGACVPLAAVRAPGEEAAALAEPELGAYQLPPLPLSLSQQRACRVDGRPEDLDLGLLPPPAWAAPDAECRRVLQQQGPRRRRHFAPLAPSEPDPHERGADYQTSRRAALTGAVCATMPRWRRKPPYRTGADGAARMHFAEAPAQEAGCWTAAFARDARSNYVRSHVHRCKKTCYKYSGADKGRGVCRFSFFHEFAVCVHRPRPLPRTGCKCRNCPWAGKRLGAVIRKFPRTAQRDLPMHPDFCPASVPRGLVRKFLRRGKPLVLPRVVVRGDAPEAPPTYVFAPRANEDHRFGRLGKAMLLRYHPQAGSSHPAGLVLLRCNWVVQCMDRVFVGLEGGMPPAAGPARPEDAEEPATLVLAPRASSLDEDFDFSPGAQEEDDGAWDEPPQHCAWEEPPPEEPRAPEAAGATAAQRGAGHPRPEEAGEPATRIPAPRASSLDEDVDFSPGAQEEDDGAWDEPPQHGAWEEPPPEEPRSPGAAGATAAQRGDARGRASTTSARNGEPVLPLLASCAGESEEDDDTLGAASDGDRSVDADAAGAEGLARRFLRAVDRMFRDAHDSAFYTGDYSTKSLPVFSSVLDEQVLGVDRLLQTRSQRLGGGAPSAEELEELGRLLLVRLQTSSNRAMIKKLPEMVFQMLYRHECFMSHGTWTVFCKKLVCLAFKAQVRAQRRARGLEQRPDDQEPFDYEFLGVEEEALAASDEEPGATMYAVVDEVPARREGKRERREDDAAAAEGAPRSSRLKAGAPPRRDGAGAARRARAARARPPGGAGERWGGRRGGDAAGGPLRRQRREESVSGLAAQRLPRASGLHADLRVRHVRLHGLRRPRRVRRG